MGKEDRAGPGATMRPLFLLSFRQRDELAALFARAGWHVVAARRADGAPGRWRASGARVAIVDARGAAEDGLAAVAMLGASIEDRGAALGVLVSRADAGSLGAFHDAGATHFLVSPTPEDAIAQFARFALRHAERLAPGWDHPAAGGGDTLGWRYDPARRQVQATPALAQAIGIVASAGPRTMLRALPPDARGAILQGLKRIGDARPATALTQQLPGIGRVVHHLQYDPHSNRLHGLIEPVAKAPDAGAVVRDALGATTDAMGLARWIDGQTATGRGPALLLIALGGIEPVNRTQGRRSGDAILHAASRRIERCAREAGLHRPVVARLDGAVFAIAADGAEVWLERAGVAMGQTFQRPFVDGDRMVSLLPRIATSMVAADEDGMAAIERVRGLLPGGRASDGSTAPDRDIDAHGAGIARALTTGEVEVRFQPQVEMATGAIVGVEALARWRTGDGAEIGAETLFAAAARAGLALPVSAHVQQLALQTAAAWPGALREQRLSINVTAEDIAQPGFVDTLLDRIDASGFARQRLTIEITEGGLIAELGEAANVLARLRAAGCRVAIDDFGTGYSSLAYLKALPLDYLKIDRRLAQDITGSTRDRIVVRGVIDMARSLGLTVIAEGVETEAQRALLAAEGCELYQGFLCAEPLTDAGLVELLG